jgi:hypothetical protein
MDLTGTLIDFGTPSGEFIAHGFTPVKRQHFTISKQILRTPR